MNEIVLIESRAARSEAIERTDALDKVKALALLPDDLYVTAEMVASYFEVGADAVESVVRRNRDELTENGLRSLRGEDLREFETVNATVSNDGPVLPEAPKRRALTVFARRTVLNVAMLLRDSDVAKQVRRELLDRYEVAVRTDVRPTAEELGVVTAKIRLLDASADAGALPRGEVSFKARNLLADYGLAERPPTVEQERFATAVRWVRQNYVLGESFSVRDFHRAMHGQYWMTAGHVAEALCVELTEAGVVVRLPSPPAGRGRPPSPRFEVLGTRREIGGAP